MIKLWASRLVLHIAIPVVTLLWTWQHEMPFANKLLTVCLSATVYRIPGVMPDIDPHRPWGRSLGPCWGSQDPCSVVVPKHWGRFPGACVKHVNEEYDASFNIWENKVHRHHSLVQHTGYPAAMGVHFSLTRLPVIKKQYSWLLFWSFDSKDSFEGLVFCHVCL
jgi:hypothetical protein